MGSASRGIYAILAAAIMFAPGEKRKSLPASDVRLVP
jgi:hypothetical protein